MRRYSQLRGDPKKWTFQYKWKEVPSTSTASSTASALSATAAHDLDDLDDAETLAESQDKVPGMVALPTTYKEALSYPDVVGFLWSVNVVAHIVADGQHLPNKLLFDHNIFTIRAKNPLSHHDQTVAYIRPLKGRTDIVIMNEDFKDRDPPTQIIRAHVRVLIAIKTPDTMSRSGSQTEAMVQLVGANVTNALRSPAVVVSNLLRTHYVLILTKESTEARPHHYVIRKMKCDSFGAAVTFALEVTDLKFQSSSADFCRGPSREPSPKGSPQGSP